jgi:hypothetical protein
MVSSSDQANQHLAVRETSRAIAKGPTIPVDPVARIHMTEDFLIQVSSAPKVDASCQHSQPI